MTITEARLAEIEARAKAATPGPWCTWPNYPTLVREDTSSGWCVFSGIHKRTKPESITNASFAAAARTDIPDLASALREAWAEIEWLRLLIIAKSLESGAAQAAAEDAHDLERRNIAEREKLL